MTESAVHPEILFALADDASHFGAHGHGFVRTPNFDRVACDGVLFDNVFTTNPKCAKMYWTTPVETEWFDTQLKMMLDRLESIGEQATRASSGRGVELERYGMPDLPRNPGRTA